MTPGVRIYCPTCGQPVGVPVEIASCSPYPTQIVVVFRQQTVNHKCPPSAYSSPQDAR